MTFFESTNFFVNFLMFIVNYSKKMVAPREATLINIGMREWLLLSVQALDKGIHNATTHTHRRETAIVVQILHRNLASEVRE